MFSSRSTVSILALATLVALPACRRTPSDRTPEGTLALLRTSLATHQPPLERVTDLRVIPEATAVVHVKSIQDRFGVGVTETGMNAVLAEHAPEMDPQHALAGVLDLLRQGHCERIAEVALPDVIHPAPEPGDHWPTEVANLQMSVARRVQGAVAGDYRCDGGPSFGAVFTHPYPNDGTWRVALIGPARHR